MRIFPQISMLLFCALSLAGCRTVPGKPLPGDEAKRPDQVLDFATLYKENCSACHGERGRMGAAISLANPAYLSFAGAANLQRVTANGVHGKLMPAFSKQAGGLLTDQQIGVLAKGMIEVWGRPLPLAAFAPIAYAATLQGDARRGAQVFATSCSQCHGADGNGSSKTHEATGSLVDPTYLSLISDQALRSLIVAGQPDQGMPGTADVGAHTLNDQDVTDIVAWLASHRTPTTLAATAAVPQRRQP